MSGVYRPGHALQRDLCCRLEAAPRGTQLAPRSHRKVVGETVLQVCFAGVQVGVGLLQLRRQRAAVLLARHQLVAQVGCGGCGRSA